MSRMSSDAIVVRPTNNVYTVLAIVAFLLELIAFIALVMKAKEAFPTGGIF
jgi:hypothetical protein